MTLSVWQPFFFHNVGATITWTRSRRSGCTCSQPTTAVSPRSSLPPPASKRPPSKLPRLRPGASVRWPAASASPRPPLPSVLLPPPTAVARAAWRCWTTPSVPWTGPPPAPASRWLASWTRTTTCLSQRWYLRSRTSSWFCTTGSRRSCRWERSYCSTFLTFCLLLPQLSNSNIKGFSSYSFAFIIEFLFHFRIHWIFEWRTI